MPIVASSTVTLPAYASRSDIESLYGVDNVKIWADLQNEADENLIANRVADALTYAAAEINDRLPGYTLSGTYPMVRLNAARQAGIWLYESRGVKDILDEEGRHRLSYHKKQFDKWIQRVLAGTQSVGGQLAQNYPNVLDTCGEVSAP
jgi:hypothetical protein